MICCFQLHIETDPILSEMAPLVFILTAKVHCLIDNCVNTGRGNHTLGISHSFVHTNETYLVLKFHYTVSEKYELSPDTKVKVGDDTNLSF